MAISHKELIDLGVLLGYPLSYEGLCQGFSGMWVQAALAKDLKTFYKRLEIIESYKEFGVAPAFNSLQAEIIRLKQKEGRAVLTAKETKILEIPALYEGINLYLSPYKFPEWFANKYLNQSNIKEIYRLTKPQCLNDQNYLIAVDEPNCFDHSKLTNYFNDLKEVLRYSNAAIFLGSDNHSVCLRFDPCLNLWEYVDTNCLASLAVGTYSIKLNSEQLSRLIFESFGDVDYTVFTTTVVANKFDYINKEQLDYFKKAYQIQPSEANIVNSRQCGILHLACQEGYSHMIGDLIKKGVNVNQTKATDGFTPLHIACGNGRLNVVKELIKGSHAININSLDHDKNTPLILACWSLHNLNNIAIFNFLLKKGSKITLKNTYGYTAFDIAFTQGNIVALNAILKAGSSQNIPINRIISAPIFAEICKDKHNKQEIDSYTNNLKHQYSNLGLNKLGFFSAAKGLAENAVNVESNYLEAMSIC